MRLAATGSWTATKREKKNKCSIRRVRKREKEEKKTAKCRTWLSHSSTLFLYQLTSAVSLLFSHDPHTYTHMYVYIPMWWYSHTHTPPWLTRHALASLGLAASHVRLLRSACYTLSISYTCLLLYFHQLRWLCFNCLRNNSSNAFPKEFRQWGMLVLRNIYTRLIYRDREGEKRSLFWHYAYLSCFPRAVF